MVKTRLSYQTSGESLHQLTTFRGVHLTTAILTTVSASMSTKESFAQSMLADQVAKLSFDMATVLEWIKHQASSSQDGSGGKAKVMSTREGFEGILNPRGKEQDDSNDSDDDTDSDEEPFKVEAKVDIPTFDGSVDADKLDSWIDQLETYFTLRWYSSAQKVMFAPLKMIDHAKIWWKAHVASGRAEDLTWSQFKQLLRQEFYPMGYLEERWNRWHYLRQRRDQSVQDYTTKFRHQATALGISFTDPQTFRKYTAGLHRTINVELSLFHVHDVTSASATAMAIEKRNKSRSEKAIQDNSSKSKKKKNSKKGNSSTSSSSTNKYCEHCDVIGHTKDKCWKLHPELFPKKWKKGERGKSTAMATMTPSQNELE